MQSAINVRRYRRVGVTAAILVLLEIFFFHYKWLSGHLIGMGAVPFQLSKKRICAYIFILVLMWLWDRLRPVLSKVDHRFSSSAGVRWGGSDERFYPRLPATFALIALSFGVVLVFLVPPFCSPDENAHFHQAQYVANGQLFAHVEQDKYPYGTTETADTPLEIEWTPVMTHLGKTTFEKLYSMFQQTISTQTTPNAYRYPNNAFLVYLPQAVGILTGRVLHVAFGSPGGYNVYQQMLYARLFNLFFYVCMSFAALSFAPVFRRTLFFAMLMPMTLFMASTCNADVFVYAGCFLFLGFVLHLAFDDRVRAIRWWHFAALAVLLAGLLFAKQIYGLLAVFCFLIPKEKYQSLFYGRLRPWLQKIAGLLLPVLVGGVLFAIWYLLMKHSIHGMMPGSDYLHDTTAATQMAKSEALQTQFVLHHPLRTLYVLYDSFLRNDGYIYSMVGIFGWLDTPLPNSAVYTYLVLLAVSAALERMPRRVLFRMWLLLCTCILALGALVMLSQYICWTPHPDLNNGVMVIGGTLVYGIQGRYFIPMLPAALFLLVTRSSRRSAVLGYANRWLTRLAWVPAVGFLCLTVVTIVRRYYVL